MEQAAVNISTGKTYSLCCCCMLLHKNCLQEQNAKASITTEIDTTYLIAFLMLKIWSNIYRVQ